LAHYGGSDEKPKQNVLQQNIACAFCAVRSDIFFAAGHYAGADAMDVAAAPVAQMAQAAASPGTPSDPLVSRSYVDEKINQLMLTLTASSLPATDELVGEVLTKLEFLYGDKLTGSAAGTAADAQTYVPVSVSAGQLVLGGEGTEIILRSGRADSFCQGANGLVDVTAGADVLNGQPLAANHLLIVPRDDNRGAAVREDAWFMIKGSYRILS
jgi:hypothetical protein